MSGSVRSEVRSGVAWITIDRPPRNLIDAEATIGLAAAVRRAQADPEVAVLVLTGAGDTFCGGADGAVIRATGTGRAFADAAVDVFGLLAASARPVIAAVNGDALAGGFGLACAADVVVAVEAARLGTIEASLGTWPMIAQVPASRRVPAKALLANALTGVPFPAPRARELGVIDEVVRDVAELEARVAELAVAVQGSKAAGAVGLPLLRSLPDLSYAAALRAAADEFVKMLGG